MQRLTPEWHYDAICGPNGKPLSILKNAILALREDPAFTGLFGFDEMARCAVVLQPMDDNEAGRFRVRPMTDVDVTTVQARLQGLGLTRISKDIAHQAVAKVANERRRVQGLSASDILQRTAGLLTCIN